VFLSAFVAGPSRHAMIRFRRLAVRPDTGLRVHAPENPAGRIANRPAGLVVQKHFLRPQTAANFLGLFLAHKSSFKSSSDFLP
jgi:hypothetical protein